MFGPETVNKDVVKGVDAEQRPAVCMENSMHLLLPCWSYNPTKTLYIIYNRLR